jgi:hypothetical protein
VLPPKSTQIYNSLGDEAIYLKYLLTVFSVLYEVQGQGGMTAPNVGNDTLERLFWCLHSCGPLYAQLESDPDGLSDKFEQVLDVYRKDKSLLIAT